MKRKDAPRNEWLQRWTCKMWCTVEGSLERHQNQTGCCGPVQDPQEALNSPATATAAQQEPLGEALNEGPPLEPEIATEQGSHDLAIQLTATAARLQMQRQQLSQQLSLSEEPGDSDSSPLLDHRLTEVEAFSSAHACDMSTAGSAQHELGRMLPGGLTSPSGQGIHCNSSFCP